jgi:hypothetical protein
VHHHWCVTNYTPGTDLCQYPFIRRQGGAGGTVCRGEPRARRPRPADLPRSAIVRFRRFSRSFASSMHPRADLPQPGRTVKARQYDAPTTCSGRGSRKGEKCFAKLGAAVRRGKVAITQGRPAVSRLVGVSASVPQPRAPGGSDASCRNPPSRRDPIKGRCRARITDRQKQAGAWPECKGNHKGCPYGRRSEGVGGVPRHVATWEHRRGAVAPLRDARFREHSLSARRGCACRRSGPGRSDGGRQCRGTVDERVNHRQVS